MNYVLPKKLSLATLTIQATLGTSMKLGIMQPYVFPYIGYFQLINLVDQFVIYDDVQYMKGGWINRNRILVNGQAQFVSLPVKKSNLESKINQREFADDWQHHKKKIIKQVQGAYVKAPHLDPVSDLVSRCFAFDDPNVARFITHSLKLCCEYLGIETPFILSSDLDKADDLDAQQRVLAICKLLDATQYVNPIGGMDLYDKQVFSENGLALSFIETKPHEYPQFTKHEFVPFLSIIDVMMFNSPDEIRGMMDAYDLR